MTDLRLTVCSWCSRRNVLASGWEQQGLLDSQWRPLCRRCAKKRLMNPYNALIPMRRIEEAQP